MDSLSVNYHTQGVVNEYFRLESRLLSTRSADVFSALDISRNMNVALWVLRHPLPIGSEAVKRFLSRMQQIEEIKPPISRMSAYGVDRDGIAFAVLAPLDGLSILDGNVEKSEGERRFMGCLSLVKQLHAQRIVCGDLCDSSFWITRDGSIEFIGVMGSFDAEAAATAMMPPPHTMRYLAPEQRSGSGLVQASDVYALGVLGYALITRKLPFGEDLASVLAGADRPVQMPSEVAYAPPPWADTVLLRCLAKDPAARYQSAGEILEAISFGRQRAADAASMPVPARQPDKKAVSVQLPDAQRAMNDAQAMAPVEYNDAPAGKRRIGLRAFIGVAVVVLLAVLGAGYWKSKPQLPDESNLRKGLEPHLYVTSKELGSAIEGIARSDLPLTDRARFLDIVAASDDPVAHHVLVTAAREAVSESFRKQCERAIIDRARRLGLIRSAEEVKLWLDSLKSAAELPSYYASIFNSLDNTLPVDARSSALREAYADNPDFVLRLTAALALDSVNLNDFQPVLAQLIADAYQTDDLSSHSALAVLLISPELSLRFGDDVVQKRDSLPDNDLLWIIGILAERTDINLRALASLTLERQLVPPIRAKFLQIARDRPDLPSEVLTALVRASAGAVRTSDISALGKWYDVAVERILFAICADDIETSLAIEAFDTVASKSLTIAPSAQLVEWVRDKHWANRSEFVRPICVFANADVVGDEKIAAALGLLEPHLKDPKLVKRLIQSRNPVILRAILQRYQQHVSIGDLIPLLGDGEKDIKLMAIQALKGQNDVALLQMVINLYEHETDPDIKKAYEDNFWVIKERNSAAGNSAGKHQPPL